MSKLLINEPPLQVLPTLARLVGLNEAIILQQIHYWISNPKVGKEHAGKRWVYNSLESWREECFPFWSTATIKRALNNLRDQGLVIAQNLNEKTYDRTLWYTIDYQALNTIGSDCTDPFGQNDPMDEVNLTQPIPETTRESFKDYKDDDDFDALYAEAVAIYESNIGMLTPILAAKLADAVGEYPAGWVPNAISVAVTNQARSFNYITAVLENWKKEGFRPNGKKQPAQDDSFAEPVLDEVGGYNV